MRTTSPSPDATLRVAGASRRAVTITVDGKQVEAREGEALLAALWAAGVRALHRTAIAEEPRAFLCGIGVCFECLVTVDGERSVRACTTPVADGMQVETQHDAGWEGSGHAAA